MPQYPPPRPHAHKQQPTNTFFASQHSAADLSWSALVESLLVHPDRERREFTRADLEPASMSMSTSALSTRTRTHVLTHVEPYETMKRYE
jgi:hypothetical protein